MRITRTPGRQDTKNCVNLYDVIHKENPLSACIFSFFIGGDELFRHLPLSHASNAVPASVSFYVNFEGTKNHHRSISAEMQIWVSVLTFLWFVVPPLVTDTLIADPLVAEACRQVGVPFKEKLGKKQLQEITPQLRQLYTNQYGKNYHAFYGWSSGSSHSKLLVLVYRDFLRIIITSCNMMDIDTVLGDNHWYIHDLPKLPSRVESVAGFEEDLLGI